MARDIMPPSLVIETELPGRKTNLDTLQIIAHRYFWASGFVTGKDVLEVGCGPGFGLGWLSHCAKRVIGGDITGENLALAKKHYDSRVEIVSLDAHKLPFKADSLDVVICVAAIIYMDVGIFFDECRRALRSGGMLLINTPNKDQPGFRPSQLSRRYYSVPELFLLLDQRGFDAKLFGAFETQENSVRLQSPLSAWLAIARKAVSKPLKVLGIYDLIRILAALKSTSVFLSAELNVEDMRLVEHVPLVPLPHHLPALQHRIVYAMAQLR
jgi:SAM-dependent methyltransferase